MPNAIAVAVALFVSAAAAQTPAQTPVRAPGTTVLVTAQKEPADPATLPVSVTTVTEDVLNMAGVTFISDIASLSPLASLTQAINLRFVSHEVIVGGDLRLRARIPGRDAFLD